MSATAAGPVAVREAAARRADALAGAAFVLMMIALAGPIAPMGITTALCGVFTVTAFVLRRRVSWPATPSNVPGLVWFAALLVVSLAALDRAGSLPRITKGFFPLLVGLAALRAPDRRAGERAIAAYFAAAALVSVVGLALWIGHGASFEARARGLSGHYMTFAGQLALQLPVAAAVAVCDRRPRWRIGAAVAAALTLVALAVTFTRSAWLGVFTALAVIALAVRPLAVLVLAALAALAARFAPGAFGARLRSVFDLHNTWNQQREFMWQAGARMFRDHPFTGVGLQDLRPLYDVYKSPGATERAGHLHNVYIQIAAQMGVLGLAAFAWLYASFFRCALAGLRTQLRGGPDGVEKSDQVPVAPHTTRTSRPRALALIALLDPIRPPAQSRTRGFAAGVRLGVVAALAGFLVSGLFEWNFGDEELLYALYTLAGLAWAARAWEREA